MANTVWSVFVSFPNRRDVFVACKCPRSVIGRERIPVFVDIFDKGVSLPDRDSKIELLLIGECIMRWRARPSEQINIEIVLNRLPMGG